jgi:hypothetical protein
MIHELKQVMYVETPHGRSQVLFIMDYGMHENTIWICANEPGEIRHYSSSQIKLEYNHTSWWTNQNKDGKQT